MLSRALETAMTSGKERRKKYVRDDNYRKRKRGRERNILRALGPKGGGPGGGP